MKNTVTRITLFLILQILVVAELFAVVSSETLDIRAYKNYNRNPGDDFMAIYITDAITSSLEMIAESNHKFSTETPSSTPKDLNITPYLENRLLGTMPEDNETVPVSEDNIIFSYRAIGNVSSNYTISLEIEPFKQQLEGQDNPYIIETYYQMMNENVVFQNTSSVTTSGENPWRIELTQIGDHDVASANESAIIKTMVSVKDQNGSTNNRSVSDDVWIARGAIAAVIDRTDYEGAPEGDYRAYCKVLVDPE